MRTCVFRITKRICTSGFQHENLTPPKTEILQMHDRDILQLQSCLSGKPRGLSRQSTDANASAPSRIFRPVRLAEGHLLQALQVKLARLEFEHYTG
mmetsp:Transcript_73687/g.117240  ORF Transcript_73687/g.117240 Transcript_73687/m.117240 type:complete len:96 (-) Transcript_73687:152-439(-)